MSAEIVYKSEIKSKSILIKALTKMGHQFTESSDTVTMSESWHDTVFNCSTGEISCDDMAKTKIEAITQQYQIEFWHEKAIEEGCQIEETVDSKGDIVIRLTR